MRYALRSKALARAPESRRLGRSRRPSNTLERQVISIDEFRRVELRVALVTAAERVPGATRLLRLEIDLGEERRQIVAGVAQWYAPEDLLGKRIIVVANLQPATIRGLESQGMLLAAGGRAPGAELEVLMLDKDIPPGTRVE